MKQSPTARRPARGKGLPWPGLAGTAVIIAAAAVILVLLLRGQGGEKALLEVDGETVYETQYRWAMYEARDDVLAELSAAGIPLGKWDEPTELGAPCDLIVEKAVDYLKWFYAVGEVAVERGYLSDASFAALQTQRERTNESRAEDIAAGEIVTGLTSYDLDTFIQYRADGLRREYCSDDANPGMAVSEEELLRRYERDKLLYARADDLELYYLEIDGPALGLDGKELDALAERAEELRRSALSLGSLEQAAAADPELLERCQAVSIGEDNYSAYLRSAPELLNMAEKLDSGELSEVSVLDGVIRLVQCEKRVGDRYAGFDEVRSVVERSIREDYYDGLVRERTGAIEAEYDFGALRRYTLDRLN